MHPVISNNTLHDVTYLVNQEMVKKRKLEYLINGT